MGTKLGLHITPGSRNGYGPVAEAAPAVVLSIGDSAPLEEAWDKSQKRTITIYRDMTVYEHGNAPEGFPQMTVEQARAAADKYWPRLRAEYAKHPADYYQPTNEIAGGLEDAEGSEDFEVGMRSVRNLIAYEMRLMELSEADGGRFKLAVASLSGGTPGRFELWKELFVPLIRRAGEGGHIYSRHAYGPGLLTAPGPAPTDGNAGRPFKEAAYLRLQGIHTPMVITEAGPNAGYKFPGVGEFMADVKRYDQLCQQHDNIWGFCCWTYGGWREGKPNIQNASGELAAYLRQQGGAVRPQYPAVAVTGTPAVTAGAEPEPVVATAAVATTSAASQPAGDGRDVRSVTAEAGLFLREGPSTDADVKRGLPFGTVVEVLEDGPWARVRAGGDIGFVSSEFLSATGGPAPDRPRPERPTGGATVSREAIGIKRVTAPLGLKLRSGPTQGDSEIMSMQQGTVVEVVEEGEWDLVRVAGEEGYASSEWLSALAPIGAARPEAPARTGEGFDSPVGTADERRGEKVWPEHWIDATPYLKEYSFGQPVRTAFHTGADLNLNFPHHDADKDKPVHACAAGVVIYARLVPNSSWGKLVVIRHKMPDGRPVHSRYGHLKGIGVEEGQQVERGRQVGTIGGVDYGLANHLHFDISLSGVLERNPTHWPGHNEAAVREHYVDPRQFIRSNRGVASPARPERLEATVDLLSYIKGDGRQYEVRNAFGSQERFQTREEGRTFYLVKNAQWEQFFYDDDFIYRDIDTSPGSGRYYRLTDPDRHQGSRWLRRRMAVGETYTQQRRVQFYNKADGAPSAANSGSVTDTMKLVARHGRFRFQTDLEVEDVLEFHWVKSESDHTPKEKYYYARGLGMVGWARAHEDPNSPSWSAVSEIHERGTRDEIPREHVTLR